MADLTELTISQAHEGLKAGKFTSVDLTKAYLENIKKLNKELNVYISYDEKSALEMANEADKKIKTGTFDMLCGIPGAVKDAILVEGHRCTMGSKILENYVATYDATVVKRLKEAGAVILGKTNLDEFAMGSSTEKSAFGPTKNPHDPSRVPGGSSGGSAAAIAANMAAWSLGTDTGGSIRQPASFCGVAGLCPTYGSVSRYGAIAHASSLDQIGTFGKTAEDAKIVFKAICGKDQMDATSTDYKFEESNISLKSLKIGVPKEYFAKGIDHEVEVFVKSAIEKAKDQGAEIVEISLPTTEYAMACYYIIGPSEISANLAKFDGIRYGLSVGSDSLLDVYVKSRGQGFGDEPKRRIMIGTYCLSSGYYDAYYKKAQEVRELIRQDFARAFSKVDLIFTPVAPSTAFKIGEKGDDPIAMYLADIYTIPMKLAGLTGISIPVGKIGKLPVGLQIIGNNFEDNKVLAIAQAIEKL